MSTRMCGIASLFQQRNSSSSSPRSCSKHSSGSGSSALGPGWLERSSSSSWDDLSSSNSPSSSSSSPPRNCGAAPPDVPEGSLALYVGSSEQQRRRFVVGTAHLNHPLFRPLLDKAADEYGYHYQSGALTIPCDARLFQHVVWLLDHSDDPATQIAELLSA